MDSAINLFAFIALIGITSTQQYLHSTEHSIISNPLSIESPITCSALHYEHVRPEEAILSSKHPLYQLATGELCRNRTVLLTQ